MPHGNGGPKRDQRVEYHTEHVLARRSYNLYSDVQKGENVVVEIPVQAGEKKFSHTPTERRYLLRVPLILDAKKDCSRHALQSCISRMKEVSPLSFRLP